MRRQVFGLGAAELFGCAALIGGGARCFRPVARPARSGSASRSRCPRPRWCCRSPARRGPVGRGAFAMLLFEDLALVPIIFALGALAPARRRRLAGLLGDACVGALAPSRRCCSVGRFVLPRLFAQAARTKSPELFLAASLLVVILASDRHHRRRPVADRRRADRRAADRRDRLSWRSRGHDRAVQGLALGVFLITVGMSLDLARDLRATGASCCSRWSAWCWPRRW